MKVMVTGCAGFIGSHLTEYLLSLGHLVEGIDNFEPFYPEDDKRLNIVSAHQFSNFTLHEIDLKNYVSYGSLPDDIDLIIHLAGKAGVRQSILNPGEYVDSNVVVTQNLLTWMEEKNITNLIFASSSSIYGNNKKIPFSEDDNTDAPISPYAATKKSCELLNHTFHKLYNFNVINLRFFTVFGPRQRPDLAIRYFFDLIVNDQPITIFGDGHSARDYTYIDDILQGVNGAMHYIDNNPPIYDIINLGNSNPVKLIDLVKTIYSILDRPENIIYEEMQPGDVNITYADIAKAKRILDYNPQTTLESGLIKFSEWYFEHAKSKTNGSVTK